jgi:hypothetical protein
MHELISQSIDQSVNQPINQSILEIRNALSFITSGEPNKDHHLEQLVFLVPLSRECVFGEPLPSKWSSASVP